MRFQFLASSALALASMASAAQKVAAMRVIADPMRPVAACIFHDVAPGVYMISAVHDENDDGKLDKNLFGAPKEGYAVSNNHTYILKGPDFKESSVELHDGPNTIELRLRYPGPDSTR
jgi:uncharacterized protein (DUF2141 family)